MNAQFNGSIKYVNPLKRFGFITPTVKGAPDIYFSFEQLRGHASRPPRIGEKVVYEVGSSRRGPVCTTVYNMADPLAVEDYQADIEVAKSLENHWKAAHEGRKAFTAALYERNRQWHAARTPSAKEDASS
jgi:cold shock CspA family protein